MSLRDRLGEGLHELHEDGVAIAQPQVGESMIAIPIGRSSKKLGQQGRAIGHGVSPGAVRRRVRCGRRRAPPACGSARRACSRMLLTWVLTVFSPMVRLRAISLFAWPSASSRSTSVSRSVSASGLSGVRTSRSSRAAACGRELHLAGGGRLDRAAQLVGLGVLEQVADGARAHRADHGGVFQHARQRQDFDVGHARGGCCRWR